MLVAAWGDKKYGFVRRVETVWAKAWRFSLSWEICKEDKVNMYAINHFSRHSIKAQHCLLARTNTRVQWKPIELSGKNEAKQHENGNKIETGEFNQKLCIDIKIKDIASIKDEIYCFYQFTCIHTHTQTETDISTQFQGIIFFTSIHLILQIV